MLRRPPRSTRTDTLFPTRRSSDLLKAGKLESVSLERERLKLQPMPPVTPPEAEALDRKLDALLPRVRITELLLEVAERTGFLTAFRDLRSGKEHDNPNAVLAAILADGTNLGLERRSEEHTSELQSLMRNSYSVF